MSQPRKTTIGNSNRKPPSAACGRYLWTAFDDGPEPWQRELGRLEQAERKVVDLWSAFLDHREEHGCELESRWLGYTA